MSSMITAAIALLANAVSVDGKCLVTPDSAGVAIIPSGTISIPVDAFYRCMELIEVVIPATVETVGDFAFDEAKNLKEVVIPATVTYVGEFAFDEAVSLERVTFAPGSQVTS
eukprot:CAMPEP_0194305388 /NCGR_PEP_ID=MMETSP0171-20130528/2837_1 /TAXON_ID=218684 /ORGANISM="Corethron pennatum, Strain L29A3" /LENGTH=111 /DNA_ID=CAMNT_0039056905 /DNA_START=251 /DNA_END=583 /DNA_ORIENTATION=+